ncbi:MAG: hypothetical protein KatS3mg051_1804 [Anaerolineae bacterium]|nr:MAG: hypothetical protein KatS3mg051_1804 [Anaerolineae bacterium]
MTATRLYHTIMARLREMRPHERVTRLRNLSWLMVGIFLSRSVHLHRAAAKMPGPALNLSKERRLRRFVHNRAVQVRDWYEPMARALLMAAHGSSGVVRLILDATKVGTGHQWLVVALAYRRRALPIAWTWVPHAKGHSKARVQCALLAYVRRLLPEGAQVEVVGDSEFSSVAVIEWVESWGWHYALRQKGHHKLRRPGQEHWEACGDLVTAPGQKAWLEDVELTESHGCRTNFLAVWRRGEKEPLLLATSAPSARAAQSMYRRRPWLDETFGDSKGHGFDLEATHLRSFRALSRLILAVVLLYVWTVAFGSQTIKNGLRRLVDRSDRRDLSVFRIGLYMLERCLANGDRIAWRLIPYFT